MTATQTMWSLHYSEDVESSPLEAFRSWPDDRSCDGGILAQSTSLTSSGAFQSESLSSLLKDRF